MISRTLPHQVHSQIEDPVEAAKVPSQLHELNYREEGMGAYQSLFCLHGCAEMVEQNQTVMFEV